MHLILLILAHATTIVALTDDNGTGPGLDCTFVSDNPTMMSCDFVAPNCPAYNVTLQKGGEFREESHCIPTQCSNGRCCCHLEMILIYEAQLTASVWKGGQKVESKTVFVTKSVKPPTPTLMSVEETNGNFLIKWKTNAEGSIVTSLTASLTYYKQGDTKKVTQNVDLKTVDGMSFYEIVGQTLEPSTAYMVSVRSLTRWSNKFSDSSKELEFKTRDSTAVSNSVQILSILLPLCIAAVLISGAAFGCYIKLKTKWSETVAKCPRPKLPVMHPCEKELFKPEFSLITSSVCVERLIPDDSQSWLKSLPTDAGNSQQSSGMGTGLSSTSYAVTESADIMASVHEALGKAFPNIGPISPGSTNMPQKSNLDKGFVSSPNHLDPSPSGLTGFSNQTYSILIPGWPQEMTMDGCEVQKQADVLCDSAYRPIVGDVVTPPDQQDTVCQLLVSPPPVSTQIPTDMSYQLLDVNSRQYTNSEGSRSSWVSGETKSMDSSGGNVEEGLSCAAKANGDGKLFIAGGENLCCGSRSFPPVEDAYQAFETLVGSPGAEGGEHLDKSPEDSCSQMSPAIPGVLHNVRDGQDLHEFQRPCLALISANQPITLITEGAYQCV